MYVQYSAPQKKMNEKESSNAKKPIVITFFSFGWMNANVFYFLVFNANNNNAISIDRAIDSQNVIVYFST